MSHPKQSAGTVLTTLGLAGLVAGCASTLIQPSSSGPAIGAPAALMPATALIDSGVVEPLVGATPTPWPTPTLWPTPTSWPTPVAWQPVLQPLPTLAPILAVPASPRGTSAGSLPANYSPPDGVDVFGSTILRWAYYGELAADEYFDIKIKPLGSTNSAFVDWTRATEYELRPWSGWTAGVYTWQIGIIKGYREGETKRFIADTGRDSQPSIIKWQAAGGDRGGGSNNVEGGGGNTSGGS